jgi:plastocyanin
MPLAYPDARPNATSERFPPPFEPPISVSRLRGAAASGSNRRVRYYDHVVLCRVTLGCIFALTVTACGGGGAGPTTPSVPGEITVNVTSSGFKPSDAVVAVGGRVTFDNVDDRIHSIASLPLTTHSDCPAINEVGVLVPGQSKPTGALMQAKTCGYHDVFSEGGQLLTGTITVR